MYDISLHIIGNRGHQLFQVEPFVPAAAANTISKDTSYDYQKLFVQLQT